MGLVGLTLAAFGGAAVVVAAMGLGMPVSRWLGRCPDWLVAVAAGLAVGGAAMWAAGWTGLMYPLTGRAAALAGAVLLLRRSPRHAVAAAVRGLRTLAARKTAPGIGAVLVVLLGVSLVAAFTPPTMYDALAYHLTDPQQAILAHKIFAAPWLTPSWYPFLADAGFGWAFLVGPGPLAPRGWAGPAVVNWVHLPLTAVATARLAAAVRLTPGARLAAAAALCAIPMGLMVSGQPLADMQGTLYGTLAAVEAAAGGRPAVLLAGVWAGCAAATKWNAGALALAAVLVAAGRTGRMPRARVLAGCAAAVVLPAAPVAARNWLEAGAPCFPLFTDSVQMVRLDAFVRYLAATPRTWMGSLAAPARLAWAGPAMVRLELHQAGAIFGALYLVAALARGSVLRPLGMLAAAGWVAGFMGGWPPRYFLPIAPACATIWMACPPARIGPGWRLALLLAAAAPRASDVWSRAVIWARTGFDQDRFLASGRGQWPYGACAWVRGHTASSARVAFVFEGQTYYAQRRTFGSMVHDVAVLEDAVVRSRTVPEVARRLKQRGITHLVVSATTTLPGQDLTEFPPGRRRRLMGAVLEAWPRLYADAAAPYAVYAVPARLTGQAGSDSVGPR